MKVGDRVIINNPVSLYDSLVGTVKDWLGVVVLVNIQGEDEWFDISELVKIND